jgi:hypothetical protein
MLVRSRPFSPLLLDVRVTKLGKSWMTLGLSVAVATGGDALGTEPVERGEVLCLALEDNRRRLLKDLYQACMAHYLEQNPLPEPPFWADIADAEERLRVALSEVYAYYGGNEPMLANVLHDAPLDLVAQENMVSFYQYWDAMRDALAGAFGASGERHEALLGAVALALDFQTWCTLVRQQGLDQDRAVELMIGMARCLMST